MADIHERLRELRRKNKLTQKELAAFLGISESAYGYYEQGRNEPSIDTVIKLAKKYDVSIAYLLGVSNDHPCAQMDLDSKANEFIRDYLDASSEEREEINRFWEFIQRKRKDQI